MDTENPHGGAKCGAKTRKGTPCDKRPVQGRTRCHMHGGKTPRGIALPQFVHGKYSKALPARLRQTYEDSAGDRELVGLRDELRLTDTRLQELVGKLDAEPSRERWATVSAMVTAAIEAQPGERDAILQQLRDVVRSAGDDAHTWRDIMSTVERRRKLVDSEAKRLQRLHQMISVERALGIIKAITTSIRTHVQDPSALAKIQEDITLLLNRAGES